MEEGWIILFGVTVKGAQNCNVKENREKSYWLIRGYSNSEDKKIVPEMDTVERHPDYLYTCSEVGGTECFN